MIGETAYPETVAPQAELDKAELRTKPAKTISWADSLDDDSEETAEAQKATEPLELLKNITHSETLIGKLFTFIQEGGSQLKAMDMLAEILVANQVPFDGKRQYNILRDIETMPGSDYLEEGDDEPSEAESLAAEASLRREFEDAINALMLQARNTPLYYEDDD